MYMHVDNTHAACIKYLWYLYTIMNLSKFVSHTCVAMYSNGAYTVYWESSAEEKFRESAPQVLFTRKHSQFNDPLLKYYSRYG